MVARTSLVVHQLTLVVFRLNLPHDQLTYVKAFKKIMCSGQPIGDLCPDFNYW
ncbi:protein of unknown function [Xenorhabdus doucetiae]|uniref:Uncharacterized protein n=1 Tax=Xenorhabdus doucetiae TaxID=351671 RepID=A0A068QND2_9GAMM|nr:protein of unknown function [Xenorhabdus doucetiae]